MRLHGKIMSFGLGAASATMVWFALSKGNEHGLHADEASAPADAAKERTVAPWSAEDLRKALDALEAAGTDQERLRAAERLAQIPLEDVRMALEQVTQERDYTVHLPAKILLARWARDSPKEALRWAWDWYHSRSTFEAALTEIAGVWQWKDSAAFGRWLSQVPTDAAVFLDPPEEKGAEPALTPISLARLARPLAPDQPAVAFKLITDADRWVDEESGTLELLDQPWQIREALAALEQVKTGAASPVDTQHGYVHGDLLRRWKAIDPQGFAASEFVSKLYEPSPIYAMLSSGDPWMALSPEARTQMATEVLNAAPPEKRDSVLPGIASHWALLSPEECRAWLEQIPGEKPSDVIQKYFEACGGGESLDSALRYAGTLSPDDGVRAEWAAFKSWAKHHGSTPPDTRSWSPEQIALWQDFSAVNRAPDFW